ncbi:PilW family protein [Synechocystis salina]|uniref:Prepilin-type N-terminal cleavage/methylation domain-containing protein n=1 Tax=Synechocystis salina LEGE 00031 TaxID=1828736 RepID=A0ABR9VQJ8_9SYNC|nr:prepilin-type N-terminal cleavage/methylation domain-containing protein [Synechocystis salina]MBE9241298.1 prepilin-type N-terminal cleavage/methylation domain-containing protein [Synechocystis salina LEGE 00041]MBE9252758.1 prepilin-type N-terminal cleavage/methylation domain-containing protein [Synechocystis salina LEGE 00031]
MKLSTVYKLFLLASASAPNVARKNNRGVTVIELIVSVVIAGILLQLASFAFFVNREMYLKDAAKNDTNQNLRTVFDIVGPAITQAGEGVGVDSSFPVISIEPFPSGSDNSKLTVRQLKVSTKLRICQGLTAGAQTSITVLTSDLAAPAGCVPVDGNGDNYPDDWLEWRSYRQSNGGTLGIYIYDGSGRLERLNYTGEKIYDAGGGAISGTPSANQVASASIDVTGTLANTYTAGGATRLIIVEERTYQLNGNTLQTSIDGGSPVNLINNVGQFTVRAAVRQGNTVSQCTTLLPQTNSFTCSPTLADTYNWSQIDGIEVTSKPNLASNTPGLSTTNIDNINSRIQTQTFYPRNLINF